MANRTLQENVNQAISDFDSIQQAIIDKGIEVPNGTPTSEYADKIGTIKSGGLDTSEVTDFSNFCANNRFSQEEVNKIKTPKGTNFSNMFYRCSILKTINTLDTSKGTDFGSMFRDCSSLTSIPLLDTSNGTNFFYMFRSCSNLTSPINLDTSKGTSFAQMFFSCYKLKTIELTSFIADNSMFSSCSELENLTVTGTITVNNNYLSLSSSPKLTVDSLMSVINALSDNTGKTTYTVYLGATNLEKLTEEQKQIAIDKNYTLA